MQRHLKLALACLLSVGPLLLFTLAGQQPAATQEERALVWERGSNAVYTLNMRSRVEADSGGVLADLRLEGPLRVSVLETAPSISLQVSFEGTLRIGDGAARDAAAQREVAAFEAGLKTPYVIDLAPSGALHGLRVDPSLPSPIVKIWQAFAATLQTSAHAAGATRWSGQEVDEVGTYLADYEQDGAGSFTRTKPRYEKTRSSVATYELLAGSATFSLDAARRLRGLDAHEKMRARASSGALSFVSVMDVSLKRTAVGRGTPGTPASLAKLVAATPGQTTDAPTGSTDDARIGGRTLSSVLAALLDLQSRGSSLGEADKEHRGRAYVALAALLRRGPEHLAAVREHIEKHGPLASTLITALRDADTAESQALLAELIEGEALSREMRMDATRSLSRVEHPTADTVRALAALQADAELRVQATYGLGSNLYRLQRQQPELARSLAARLIGQLEDADEDIERATLLTALGNAGAPEALDAIEAQLASAEEYVRVAAADALRRIPGAAADQLLARAARDASPKVREKAFESISEREASSVLVATLAVAIVSEPDFPARARAVKAAIEWLEGHDALASGLAQVASQDRSEDLRELARRALQI
jgi:hypothetical protein